MSAPSLIPIVEPAALSLLRGNYVYLEFLTKADREPLRPLAKDERLWEFTKRFIIDETYDQQFDAYFDEAMGLSQIGARAFVIRSAKDGSIIGMTRLYSVDQKMKKVE